MKIAFVIRSLGVGGAERQLVALARGLRAAGHEVIVHVFYGGGALEPGLTAHGVPVIDLAKGGRWRFAGFLARLLRSLRAARADVIYAVLDVPNVLVALLRPWLRGSRIVWGVRSAYMDYSRYDWTRGLACRVEGWLARVPDLIVANSNAGAAHARARGFPAARLRVVRNGIDTERFRPDPAARAQVRAQWAVPDGECLVGAVGRMDPGKNLDLFLDAVAGLGDVAPPVRVVLVGSGEPAVEDALRRQVSAAGLDGRVIFAGSRADMPAVYNALDILCSASAGEGFPNVLAEAMACGVPCVATDVGDSADILGDFGVLVPAADPGALTRGLHALIARRAGEGADLGAACRAHVERNFGVPRLVADTERILAAGEPAGSGAAA